MKMRIKKDRMREAPEQFLRRAGYAYQPGRSGPDSFVRTMSYTPYPRFHIYYEDDGDSWTFNLHIDQKKPSYGQGHAHNAEYDGLVVSSEMARLDGLLAA